MSTFYIGHTSSNNFNHRLVQIKCPHCGIPSGFKHIDNPSYSTLRELELEHITVGYACLSCHKVTSIRWKCLHYSQGQGRYDLDDEFEQLEVALESFEYNYLPREVAADFKEALDCYSTGCLNAFAAMCRRTLQSAASELGVEGQTKIQNQLKDLREMDVIDDEMFDQMKQIMLDGHDGAHPHLPKLDQARADILLQMSKDVMTELFVRKAKLKEAMELRRQASQS